MFSSSGQWPAFNGSPCESVVQRPQIWGSHKESQLEKKNRAWVCLHVQLPHSESTLNLPLPCPSLCWAPRSISWPELPAGHPSPPSQSKKCLVLSKAHLLLWEPALGCLLQDSVPALLRRPFWLDYEWKGLTKLRPRGSFSFAGHSDRFNKAPFTE